MSVRLYDSLRGAVVDLAPRVPGRIGMYVCGPTVQSAPHIGHLRSALVYDLWRRWLTHRGFTVTFIRNVTDIDDKILQNASDTEPWFALAYRVELEFTAAYRALSILPPTYEPRATASIDRMLQIVAQLIDRGHAYPADDGSGDVYFDVRSWPAYGELTRQSPDDMEAADDGPARAKRDVRDFTLWKGAKSAEPESASWASPWGPGRPGWHIECSAMAQRYLGHAFDIHGGGLDLRFPHHENELAQSRAAGDEFAAHWVHNGLVTVGGQKMSKSLGNSIVVADLFASARPAAVRYWLSVAHYRSAIDYTERSLPEAEAALTRIESFLARAAKRREAVTEAPGSAEANADRGTDAAPDNLPTAFAAAMDDDLALPQALAALHEAVRAGNAALDGGDDAAAGRSAAAVSAMMTVLGLDVDAPSGGTVAQDHSTNDALEALVQRLIDERHAAREARDWMTADRVRDDLMGAGILLDDTPTGTDWRLDG